MLEHRFTGSPREPISEGQAAQPSALQGARHIDLVRTAGEILDHVRVSRRGVAGLVVDKGVRAATASQGVAPSAALEPIRGLIARHSVPARAANRVFNRAALGNGHIALQPAHIGKRFGFQVDVLILGEPGEVHRVDATTVPDTENRFVSSALEAHRLALSIGVEAIGGIGVTGLVIGPVQALCRCNIVHHRRGRILPFEVVSLLVFFRPITHHRTRLGILGVDRAVQVIETVPVVVPWMLQANGVADLMDSRYRKLTAQCRCPVFSARANRG